MIEVEWRQVVPWIRYQFRVLFYRRWRLVCCFFGAHREQFGETKEEIYAGHGNVFLRTETFYECVDCGHYTMIEVKEE